MKRPLLALNGRFLLQNITGVQRVEREILLSLDEMVADGVIECPEILLPSKGELVAPIDLKCIKLKRVGSLSGHLWEQFELPKYAKGKVLWCLGNTAPVLSLFARKTTVLTMVHDLSYKYFPTAYNWKFRALYSSLIPLVIRKSDAVVTVSESEKAAMGKYYRQLLDADNFHAVQNGGITDASVKEAQSLVVPSRVERGYGIFVGSLSKRKNAEGVLKAAVDFLKAYPDMRFVVIGSGSAVFDSLDVEIPEDVKSRLEMRGQVNDHQAIYDAFTNARFLLFPSFYEASPLPPIEAMTFGCPVISSTIPSLKERCGDAALYCEPNDHADIIKAIDQIMQSDDLWENLSKAGRSKAAKYSWRKQTETLLRLSRVGL